MALNFNIPMPQGPFESFKQGFGFDDNLMNQILGRQTLKQNNEQFLAKQKQLESHFQANLGLSKAAAGRAAQAAMDAHAKAVREADPLSGIKNVEALENYFKSKGMPAGNTQGNVNQQYPDLQKMFASQTGSSPIFSDVSNANPQLQSAQSSTLAPIISKGFGNMTDESNNQNLESNQVSNQSQNTNNPYGIDFDAIKKGIMQGAIYNAAGMKPPAAQTPEQKE